MVWLVGCSSDTPSSPATTTGFPTTQARAAVATYKELAHRVYRDTAERALLLQAAVDALVKAPGEATHQAAKDAWRAARVPYNQNDAFRFYEGPIDHEPGGPEASINSWPVDENFLDYTRDDASAGMINHPEAFPVFSPAFIDAQNGVQGETEITSGYHAIEFLLWGQDDLTPGTGSGKRPFTDYLEGANGTAKNQGRRGQYVQAAAALLASQLTTVSQAWEPGVDDNYASTFGVKPDENSATGDGLKDAVGNMIRGLGSLAKAELSGERMTVAIKSRDQEDEHSCFSDNTWNDLYGSALGIQNVWLGQYQGETLGPGLAEVFRAVDPALADQVTRRWPQLSGGSRLSRTPTSRHPSMS